MAMIHDSAISQLSLAQVGFQPIENDGWSLEELQEVEGIQGAV